MENATIAASPLDIPVRGLLKPGLLCSVPFALGRADVQLLDFHYPYRAGEVWHVEDVQTGHQDFVGVEWLTPNAK